MLVLSDWNDRIIEVPDYDYVWDPETRHFECELRDVDIGLIAEAVKGGRDWMSTSPAGSHPHNVDITIHKDDKTTKIQCCVWEVWDATGYNVKLEFYVWGAPNTWKGYEDYVKD